MNKQREIVVARYLEDVTWAECWRCATIYNHGPPLRTSCKVIDLPNVGREAHAYLTHVVRNYDDLAEITLFTQANWREHVGTTDLEDFFRGADVTVPHMGHDPVNDVDGEFPFWGFWKTKKESGRMRWAKRSWAQWWRCYFGSPRDKVFYTSGAIFSVKKRCILRRPKTFYQTLLDEISDHSDPEELYYLERAWLYVFGDPKDDIRCLRTAIGDDGKVVQVYQPQEGIMARGRRQPLPAGWDPVKVLTNPGDHCLDGNKLWFLPPTFGDVPGHPEAHAMHGLESPPHRFVEEKDGSLTVEGSISCGPKEKPYFHGHLVRGGWSVA